MVRLREPHLRPVLTGVQPRLLDSRHSDTRRLLHPGGPKLHRDHHQHACARYDAHAHARLRLDGADHAVPGAAGLSCAHRRHDSPDVRQVLWHALLRPSRGRPAPALAAPLLDLRPPRGLHPHPPPDGHHLRADSRICRQTTLWRVLDDLRRHRLSFGVWSHHMFAVGLGPVADSAFSLITMLIAVPTGVKIFNWISTLWGGRIRFSAPLYFALGFVGMFTLGGLSGVMHASPPVDLQQTDSYFVVAHLHYVLFGGSVFALFAGAYYWWPKVFGRVLDERLGRWQFWVLFAGFNLTFFP